ncbi:MAG: hypothetical protein ACRC6K_08720 [Fusobacteriaceae bacterium]
MFEINFYEKENGKIPVREFLEELEKAIEYSKSYGRRFQNEI